MSKMSTINIRLDSQTKEEFDQVLNYLGITQTQAINLFIKQVILNKSIPFSIKIPEYIFEKEFLEKEPNQATVQAIHNLETGKNVEVYDSEEYLKKLKNLKRT